MWKNTPGYARFVIRTDTGKGPACHGDGSHDTRQELIRIRKYICIGVGGLLGALLRFAAKDMNFAGFHEILPLGTLFVNVTGSFLLALVLTVSFEIWKFDADIRIGIATGFLGAYTTFSAFCRETAGFLESGQYLTAFIYISLSVLLGFAAVYVGAAAARGAAARFIKGRAYEKDLPVSEMDGGVE